MYLIQELGHNGESQILHKFSVLEEQLSGIERYVMRFLEAENSEIAALQLRQAEVRKIKYMIEQYYGSLLIYMYTCMYMYMYINLLLKI